MACKNSKKKGGKIQSELIFFVRIKPTPLPCPSTLPAPEVLLNTVKAMKNEEQMVTFVTEGKYFPYPGFFFPMAHVYIYAHRHISLAWSIRESGSICS